MNINMETYPIDDISVASYLLVRGARLIEVTTDRPRHSVFIFENYPLCSDLKREYLNNGSVPARELLSRRSELVSEMKNKDGGTYENR